ncbi:MAG TPA: lysophospholipid acyltransferase family protein [bacterium]|nr:lysophospholipid acyltransferase family protein [bacterium]
MEKGLDDVYRIPERPPSRFGRKFPTVYFLERLAEAIAATARLTRKPGLTDREFVLSCRRPMEAMLAVGARLEIDGLENFTGLPGPCVFIGNHMSTLETVTLPWLIWPWRRVSFVVKRELMGYPGMGRILAFMRSIPVERTNPRLDLKTVMSRGEALLAEGWAVVIFPQAHRRDRFDPGAFNTIGVRLAARAGVPVVPVAIKTDAWAPGRVLKDCGRVRPDRPIVFSFGAPIPAAGNGREAQRRVVGFIADVLAPYGLAEPEPGETP